VKYPVSIQKLIDAFSTLPTVGRKTAERYVFYLLKKNQEELEGFAEAIVRLKEKVTLCRTCFAISETDPCAICSDTKRDRSMICAVSDYRDMITIEATGQYNGIYFITGGTIDTIQGTKPEHIRIDNLLLKVQNNGIKEIILAFNPDLEGETTSMFITKAVKNISGNKIKITRLAKGLPMGADLEYADEITLSNALKYRNEL